MDEIQIQKKSHEPGRDKAYACDYPRINTNQDFNDGYKWHKYGEKALIEKSLVRSYYRCSNKLTRCRAKKCIDHIKKEEIRIMTYSFEHNNSPPVSGIRINNRRGSKPKFSSQGKLYLHSELPEKQYFRRYSLEGTKWNPVNGALSELDNSQSLKFDNQEDGSNFVLIPSLSCSSDDSYLRKMEEINFEPYEGETSEIGGENDLRERMDEKEFENYESEGSLLCVVCSGDSCATNSDWLCNTISSETNANSNRATKSEDSMGGSTYENVILFLGGQSTVSVFDFIE